MSGCNDTCKYYKNCWSRGEGLKEDGEECSRSEPDRPHGKWEYLKEHITELRDADGKLNQKQTCQFILNLMGVIEREGEAREE